MDWVDEEVALLSRNLSRAERSALDNAIREARAAGEKGEAKPLAHGRWLNVRPDPIDFRDRPYVPGLLALAQRLDPAPELASLPVRDQGYLSSCTGMALATAIDLLRRRQWSADGGTRPPPEPVSARMLYEMGQAFDEHPDDGLRGSSARGVLRGFFHNGVCREVEEDDSPEIVPGGHWRFTIDKAKDARGVLLGVYCRLSHVLLHYHCALNEIGALVVSAKIHDGWHPGKPLAEDGRIQWDGTQASVGGHAFVIVGYDDEGFLIRNSWGPGWSTWTGPGDTHQVGVGHWSYEDWERNVMDAWAIRLAVPTRHHVQAVGGYFGGRGVPASQPPASARRILVNGHYLQMLDGRLVRSGTYNCDQESMKETAALLRRTNDYDHLLIVVESGLDSLDTMVERAAVLTPYLKANRIYPLFVWWRSGAHDLAGELLEDRANRLESRTGGIPQLGARLLESFARDFLQPLWRTFEGEAERAFTDQDSSRGQGWDALSELLNAANDRDDPLEIHVLAHSAGAVWLAGLCDRLLRDSQEPRDQKQDLPGANRVFATVNLLAPVCCPDLFGDQCKPLWTSASPDEDSRAPLALYTLDEKADADDRIGAYRGSFLELARRVFPIGGRVPPLGGEPNEVLGHGSVARKIGRRHHVRWFPVAGKDVQSPCRSHRDLVNDTAVLQHVFRRILANDELSFTLDVP